MLVLMNKNTPVVAFDYDYENHLITKIVHVYHKEYAPPSVLDNKNEITKAGLNAWWRSRAIPASRAQIRTLLDDLNLDDTLALAEKNFGLSLSDRYWLNNPEEPLKWQEINFFDNVFSGDLGLLTMGQASSGNFNLMSPNSTLGGDLKKKWTIYHGKRILLKDGSSPLNLEVYNEIIATKLFERLLHPDDYVRYTFCKEGNRLFCACDNMLHEDEELITAYGLIVNRKRPNHLNDYQFLVQRFHEVGLDNVEEMFSKMFVCDFLLANHDRHYRNFGVIRNVETLEYTRIAPIFDTGNSLWCDAVYLNQLDDYKYIAKPFGNNGMPADKQLALFEDLSWLDMSKLDGFAKEAGDILRENPNISEKRIEQVQKGIEMQLQTLEHHQKRTLKVEKSIPRKHR